MEEELKKYYEQIQSLKFNTLSEIESVKAKYFGKNGIVRDYLEKIKGLSEEDKKEFGKSINSFKNEILETLDKSRRELLDRAVNEKLKLENIDVTLPGTHIKSGSAHPLEKIIEELEELFISMGYDVVEGPEVEKDLYNFEMLNLPKGHPARDAQDTFYIDKEEILLRSQTSPVQVRTMLSNEEKTPIRIVCPGKTYRRDYDDATHSHQFMQIEALLIDKDISLANLKGTLDVMAKKLFGKDTLTRFRPSFYPFTEPSVEFDVSCFKCNKKGCSVCKNTTWITIGGAGIVHPNVLRSSGYDPDVYTGFAFGFGIERIAMIKYGISDVRHFYINDLRTSALFDRMED